MADGIDFVIGWHEKSFAVMGKTMRQAGEPELGIEIFLNETEAALCACALAIATMVPSPIHRRRLSDAARKRVDEQTGCLLARANEYVKIHQPSGLERHIAQGMVGKLVEISLAAWNNTLANIKIVE